ncbi:MAG TPA: stalk domain-containing protein [Bacillota bacterium]|mgnify:FL=1|nr:stalk domain-containing protein [Bacillota bacterium]
MSRKTKILLSVFFIVAFTAGTFFGSVVNAAGGLTKLTDVYLNNDISVVINGAVFNAKDPQDGSTYVPMTYKGRTYLPLRAVAEAVGLPVDYDSNTKTAYLGTKPNTAGGPVQDVYINATPEYAGSAERYVTKKIDAGRLTTLTGKTFEFGYCGDTGRFMKPTFLCDFKYKRLKFTLYSAWDQKELETGYSSPDTPLALEITDEHGTIIKSIKDLKHGTELELDIDCIDYKSLEVYCTGGATIIGEPKFVK